MNEIPATEPGNVVLEGHIDVPSHRVAAVTEALPQHIALTQKEPGCRYFHVLPDSSISGRFHVYEIFKGRTAFEAHQARAASSPWGQLTQGIKRDYVVTDVVE